MSVPASYDANTLAEYMESVLNRTASIIGWTAPDDYAEAVNDAALLCGVDDVAGESNVGKLRAAARVALWEAVAAHTAGYHDFSEDAQSFRMHQVHQQAVAQAKQARKDAARYGVGGAVMESVAMSRTSPFAAPRNEVA